MVMNTKSVLHCFGSQILNPLRIKSSAFCCISGVLNWTQLDHLTINEVERREDVHTLEELARYLHSGSL